MRQGEGTMRALFLGLSIVMLVFPARSDAELVWVDATGKMIAPVVGDPFPPYSIVVTYYLDDAGRFWVLDPETATVFPPETRYRRYTQPGCMGPFYVSPVMFADLAPRRVFKIEGLPTLWVRRDDAAMGLIHLLSY